MIFAHISDLHISLDYQRHTIRKTRWLLEHILRLGVDHIIISGDITADAKQKEFDVARKIFKSYGLLDFRKLSIVIGNHDVFGGVHAAEDIFAFPRRCKTTDYEARIHRFAEAFHETFEKTVGQGASFPYGKQLGDFLLVGMNSVAKYSRLGNPVGSNGEVGDRQFRHAQALLTADIFRAKRKIVLIHHHFSKLAKVGQGTLHNVWRNIERQTMKLRGKRRLCNLFARGNVELVLHGHLHENREYFRSGMRFVNSGGSVLGHDQGPLRFTMLNATSKEISVRVQTVPSGFPTPQIHSDPYLEYEQAA